MQIVPLQAVPSQQLQISLGGQSCQIAVYSQNTGLYVDVNVNGVDFSIGVIARNLGPLVPTMYLGFIGNLLFVDTQGTSDPVYTGLGSYGVIIDPQPGDIGVAVFASRDISNVKSTQAQAVPGSGRRFDYSDGIYLGTVLSAAAPTQYLQFNSDGVTLLSDATLQLSGTTIKAGGSPLPVVVQPFINWVTNTLIPALAAHSITVAPPPDNSLTTVFEAT